ncbi:MAG TPA: hypothetical protein VIA18_13765, partial [Polyangia bacterium]|nr:hypothetical protein [Polyangia bacterium]
MKMSLAVAVVVVVSCAVSARAEDLQKAREALQEANQHYDLGEYGPALEAFKAAYRNHQEPALLFNIAQCERLLGQHEEAVREYRMYLIKVPDAPNRDSVKTLIEKLDSNNHGDGLAKSRPEQSPLAVAPAQLGRLRVVCYPPGAGVRIEGDGAPIEVTAPAEIPNLPPGPRRLSFSLAGYGVTTRTTDIAAGGTTLVEATLVPISSSPPAITISTPAH